MVTTPDATHAISSQNGELTVREISAETMKIPDPIIEPATSMVASVSASALTNSRDDVPVSAPLAALVAVKACPLLLGYGWVRSSRFAGGMYARRGVFARERARKLSRSRQCAPSEFPPR